MITAFLDGKSKKLEKTWVYIGRFLWGFACVESAVNEVFDDLFNLHLAPSIFASNLDLRKKITLIRLALKQQGIKQSKVFNRVEYLHDIRNVVAHAAFSPSPAPGIDFDYVHRSGDMVIPKGKRFKADDVGDTEITYSQFDQYDVEARELRDLLYNIEYEPIGVVSRNLASAIEEAINSSDNVFRLSPPKK